MTTKAKILIKLNRFLIDARDKSDYEEDGVDEDDWERGYDACCDSLQELVDELFPKKERLNDLGLVEHKGEDDGKK